MKETAGAALGAIFAEMGRQADDARASFDRSGEVAEALAASARRTGRLVLLGMGGSHAVNRAVEPSYREAGLDATAHPVSELLRAPLPHAPRTVLLASQSGESGEIVAYLETDASGEERFGLSLNPDGVLADRVASLIGHGGMEQAFAATRSLYVSLALHARVLHELGVFQRRWLDAPAQHRRGDIDAAAAVLSGATAVIFSGRGATQGLAEAAALGLLELARMPAFALEGGQVRHGPLEALGPSLAIVLIRQPEDADTTASLAGIARSAGSPVVVIDNSGSAPVGEAASIILPQAAGMAAVFAVLPALQALIIATARRRVADVGAPLRSAKVTRDL